VLLAIAMLAGAVPVTLYGVFVIGYHDGGGDSYVQLNGREVDGDLAGGIALSIAAVAVVLSIILLRRGRPSAGSRKLVKQ
jgi:hypothetical protein